MSGKITLDMIVGAWLRRQGATGLCNETAGCACGADSLMACDGASRECEPAFSSTCPSCGHQVFVPLGEVWQNNGSM